MRYSLRALILLLALLVTACPRLPGLLPNTGRGGSIDAQAAQTPPIRGTVDFSTPGRTTQTTIGEIAKGATVALIDSTTGYTIATTLSDSEGKFVLAFANGWKPTNGMVYYIEAVKGLSAGKPLPNRVGADMARVRTLIKYQDDWFSMSGLGIIVSPTTTALSIIHSLRSMTPPGAGRHIPANSLISIMGSTPGTATTPAPFTNPDPGLMPNQMVTDTYLVVLNALAKDFDPFRAAMIDTGDPLYNHVLNVPSVVSLASLYPNVQAIGGAIELIGSGFSATASENVVEFSDVAGGPVPAAVATVSADLARLTVTVPTGAVTGPIAVTVAGRKMIGPTFYLALESGHEALDTDGNLYVANESFGTIARITPQGQISTWATGLVSPRALTLRNGRLYVTCAGAKRGVVSLDLDNPLAAALDFGTSGTILDPRGIAFDPTGKAFVSDGANHKIYRIDSAASTPTALTLTGDPLNNPHGVAFGYDGRLYVANLGANNVLGITVATGASLIFKQGFSAPWCVAFDSMGNMYVSNNQGNSVYRWKKETDTLAPYADMPSPGGVVADRAGYVYAIDNNSNNLYRITSMGDSAIFASGISSPTGISKVGNKIYVLSSTNNSLVAVDTGTSALSTLARGFNNPFGLAYDNVRDCFYVSNPGNGTIVRVNRTTGASTTVLTGTGTSYGGAYGLSYRNGRLYLRSGQKVVSYDVTNFANPTVEYESVMQANMGIAKDTAGGSLNNGSYFIASSNNRILRVAGDTGATTYGSQNAANRVVVFKESDGNLNNPRDVAVDGSGKVWVANQFAPGKLVVYNPDGTSFASNIIDGLSNPLGINSDGAKVWVANYDNSTVTSYNPANGAKIDTISTGGDHPRNLCFYNGNMYLAMQEGIGKITGGVYTRINSELAGYNDIEADANGLYVLAGAGRKLDNDHITHSAWYANYHGPNFFWKDGAGEFWITDSARFTRYAMGYHEYRLIGALNWISGPTLAGVDSNGNVFLNALSVCSKEVVNRFKVAGTREEWSYNVGGVTCWVPMTGAFCNDTAGNFYISSRNGLTVQKVDSTGAATTIANSAVGNEHTTYGAWAEPDGSAVYQTNQALHRIEQLSITGTNGNRSVLPFGLSSAEM